MLPHRLTPKEKRDYELLHAHHSATRAKEAAKSLAAYHAEQYSRAASEHDALHVKHRDARADLEGIFDDE